MKIALIASSAPYGNGETFVIAEANAIADAGAQILMVPTQIRAGTHNVTLLRSAIKLIACRLLTFEILKACFKAFLKKPVAVCRAIFALRCWDPINLAKNLAVLPKALWLSEIVGREDVDHIHAHWLSTPSTVAMLASMLSGVPWSCTAHRGDIVANNLLCRKLSSAEFVRFISVSGIGLAKARCPNAVAKARLLHMGVDVPLLSAVVPKRESLVVLCPANLLPVKGHRFLIEAWSRLKTTRPSKLLLAGDGELREALQAQVIALGLEQTVEFLGHLPHSELLKMYEEGAVDLVVLPSLDLGAGLHEGIPVSLMEAMSYGIPVISTATGGIPELLEGGAGVMVTQASAVDLEMAIAELLNGDTALRQRAQGCARVAEKFNNKTISETLLKWLNESKAPAHID